MPHSNPGILVGQALVHSRGHRWVAESCSAALAYLATFANALFTDSSSRTYRWGLMLDAGRSRQGGG